MIITYEKIRDNFSCVAHRYDKFTDIQHMLSKELIERLSKEKIAPEAILDIGCGTGNLIGMLKDNFSQSMIYGVDISSGMAEVAANKGLNILVGDAIDLPFPDNSFDLIVSNVAYQWVMDLRKAFNEAKRLLTKKGIFIFSCFGANTLNEVRSSFKIKENLLPADELIYRNLKLSGFGHIELKVDSQHKYFNNLISVLYWLKNIGANRIYEKQPFLTQGHLEQVSNFYQKNYRHNGKVYATFEIIWVRAK